MRVKVLRQRVYVVRRREHWAFCTFSRQKLVRLYTRRERITIKDQHVLWCRVLPVRAILRFHQTAGAHSTAQLCTRFSRYRYRIRQRHIVRTRTLGYTGQKCFVQRHYRSDISFRRDRENSFCLFSIGRTVEKSSKTNRIRCKRDYYKIYLTSITV